MANHSCRYEVAAFVLNLKRTAASCCREVSSAKINPCFFAVLVLFSLFSPLVDAIDQRYFFDIPQQSADGALTALANQADITVSFDFEAVSQYRSNRIQGTFPVSEAVTLLLAETPLGFELGDGGHLIITRGSISDEKNTMKKSTKNRLLSAVIGLISGATLIPQTQAQNDGGQDSQPNVKATIEELVVTARKREESLQDVPVSISVLSASMIDDAGIQEPRDFFEMTPGVDFDVEHDRIGSQPAVRGVQSNNTATTRQKVTSFIDGLPMVGAAGSLGFTGVERIEVFRGPQSAAFGRATFAGAINYVTVDPGDEFEAEIQAATSEFGRNLLQVELAGPINDTFGYAFSAKVDEYDGPDDWISNEGFDLGGNSTEFVSGKLTYDPGERFSAEILVRHTETDDDIPLRYFISDEEQARCSNFTSPGGKLYIDGVFNCDTSTPIGGVPTNSDTVTPFADAPYTDADREAAAAAGFIPTSVNKRDRLQGEFLYSFDAGDVQVLAFLGEESYQRWFDRDRSDAALSIVPGSGVAAGRQVSHISDPTDIEEKMLEVRWLSQGSERLGWTLGASYYDYVFDSQLYNRYQTVVDGGEANPFLIISENSQNSAVFANLNFNLNDRTTLSFEGRYQSEDMANLNTVTNEYFVNTSTAFLPRLAINYEMENGATIYAQMSKGVNPAGVNATAASPNIVAAHAQATDLGYINWDLDSALTFDQEEIINTEIGIKGTLMDNRLQFSAAIYQMDWEHYNQIGTLPFDVVDLYVESAPGNAATDPGAPSYLSGLTNRDYSLRAYLDLGSASVTGFEGEARWLLNNSWDISGSLTLSKSEFEEYCDASAVADIGLLATNVVGDGSGVLFDCVDVSGNEFTRQPEIAYALATSYRAALGNSGWDWMARVDYRVVGEQWLDAVNMAALPKTTTVNASLTLSNESWNLQFWGRNLNNDNTPRVVEFSTDYNQSPNVSNFNLLPREPSELGATLSYRF